MAQAGWQPVQRVRAHEQVMTQIEERIISGELSAGDHLPNERELATLLGVSRPSLRESLRVLEALGIVDVRRGGEGGAVLMGTPGSGFVNLLKLQLALGQFDQKHVLETRIALETWSSREAAERSSEVDHSDLSEILDQMDADDIEAPAFNALDVAFHVRIAESTGNSLCAHLMHSLRTAINRQMINAYKQLPDWRETAKVVREEHRSLLHAIINGDSGDAFERAHKHITDFYELGTIDLRPREEYRRPAAKEQTQ
ncbi:FadR/GntR family transcriptional regulator [Paramicrobacterium chengjingii]|uniref:FadR/GntR family transcriptional regulator n=1 Tax=Paramicrobacterium chengjingii TaxID=2769067 RepID=UPI001AB02DAF|nr:FadR/GntR family transcriptional regulator [Microbacterium chengjingii]